ncbi:MAG TPA: hypothetical protein VEI96_11960 [Thermodesulfovibrionales bacterium]|nr:hypothetical protein [Thermodesulfovibrionales bacterium]
MAVFLMGVLSIACGCAGGIALRTERVQDVREINGLYTLILYSEGQYDSLRTLGFLSLEGTGYFIEPYVPDFYYSVWRNVSGQYAFPIALAFVGSKNPDYKQARVSKILDPVGITIGYEIRPLYYPLAYGLSDVLFTSYFLEPGGIIRVYIRLDETVEDHFATAQGR